MLQAVKGGPRSEALESLTERDVSIVLSMWMTQVTHVRQLPNQPVKYGSYSFLIQHFDAWVPAGLTGNAIEVTCVIYDGADEKNLPDMDETLPHLNVTGSLSVEASAD